MRHCMEPAYTSLNCVRRLTETRNGDYARHPMQGLGDSAMSRRIIQDLSFTPLVSGCGRGFSPTTPISFSPHPFLFLENKRTLEKASVRRTIGQTRSTVPQQTPIQHRPSSAHPHSATTDIQAKRNLRKLCHTARGGSFAKIPIQGRPTPIHASLAAPMASASHT